MHINIWYSAKSLKPSHFQKINCEESNFFLRRNQSLNEDFGTFFCEESNFYLRRR